MGNLLEVEQENDYFAWKEYRSIVNFDQLVISIKKILEDKVDTKGIFDQTFTITSVLKKTKELYNDFTYNTLNNFVYENITFCNCSNIFLDKIKYNPTNEEIEKGMDYINKIYNREVMTDQTLERVNQNCFNVLDIDRARINNKLYMPVFEYNEKIIKMLFLLPLLDKNGNKSFYVCSVRINRETFIATFHMNNLANLNNTNINGNEIKSTEGFYEFIKVNILPHFKLFFISHADNYECTREKMFEFCNHLNTTMIEEIKVELSEKISEVLKKQIAEITSCMGPIVNFTDECKGKLEDKVFATYLGEYSTRLLDAEDLKEIASERKLPGYPNQISFIGVSASKGQAATQNKDLPLTAEELYYSLSTDFDMQKELENWRISWFDTNFFDNASSSEVSQSRIKSSKNLLKIVIHNNKRINEKMVNFIVDQITQCIY